MPPGRVGLGRVGLGRAVTQRNVDGTRWRRVTWSTLNRSVRSSDHPRSSLPPKTNKSDALRHSRDPVKLLPALLSSSSPLPRLPPRLVHHTTTRRRWRRRRKTFGWYSCLGTDGSFTHPLPPHLPAHRLLLDQLRAQIRTGFG